MNERRESVVGGTGFGACRPATPKPETPEPQQEQAREPRPARTGLDGRALIVPDIGDEMLAGLVNEERNAIRIFATSPEQDDEMRRAAALARFNEFVAATPEATLAQIKLVAQSLGLKERS